MSAILDMKWSYTPLGNHPVVGIANATGEMQLHKLCLGRDTERHLLSCASDEEDDSLQCTEMDRIKLGEDRLELSLDWSNALQYRYQDTNLQCRMCVYETMT